MKIFHNQLNQTLSKGLPGVMLIFGDEIWQKNDAIKQYQQAAFAAGFTERVQLTADDRFAWQTLLDEFNNLSLFANQRVIEVDVLSFKNIDSIANQFIDLANNRPDDTLLLLYGNKLDGKTSNKKWFKALENNGCYLPLYELDNNGIQRWLKSQLSRYQLKIESDAQQLLIESYEGNIPALDQELQKLILLFNQATISRDDIEQLLTVQAKFTPFQLIDAMLAGDLKRGFNMINQMQQDGTAFGQVFWLLHKELEQLIVMQEQLKDGQTQTEVFKSFKVWDKKKPLYQHALSQYSEQAIKQALQQLIQLDLISKRDSDFNCFELLKAVLVTLTKPDLTQPLSFDLV